MVDMSGTNRVLRRIFSLILVLMLLGQVTGSALAAPQFSGSGAAGGLKAAQQSQAVPRFEPSNCTFKYAAQITQGRNIQCGYLVVPETYENASGPTIRLAVVVFKAANSGSASDPLFMLQGGPGGSTIEIYTQLLPLYPQFWRDRDVVLFDQRGTLYSQPALMCPEYDKMVLDTLDVKLSDEESNKAFQDAMRACRSRLAGEGINLGAYNSRESAGDVDALRQVLGYAKIDLYGVSYGTLLAQHVMRFYPGGLRTVILDGVVPTNVNVFNNIPRLENRAFEALFSACSADTECNQNYPNLRQVFYDTVDRLNANPVHIQLTDPDTNKTYASLMDGDSLIGSIFQMIYMTELVPFLPRTIYDARAGKFDLIERIMSQLVFDRSTSYGMYYSVNCSEDGDVTPNPDDLKNLPPEIVNVEKNNVEYYLQTCATWNVPALGSVMDEPVKSDIPTLLLSGQFDPVAPEEYAKDVASSLPHSYSFLFPWGGHGSVGTNECANTILLEFLNNPSSAPDASCITTHGNIQFMTPSSLIHLPVVPELVNLALSLQGSRLVELVVYFVALFLLLTALGIYPLVWLVRLGRRSSADSASALSGAAVRTHRPRLYRVAPWLAAGAGLAIFVFTLVVVGVIFNMIATNDPRYLAGLPGSARPVFVLPLLAALLTMFLIAAALVAWARRAGSTWGRLYLTLVTAAAVACLVVLGSWGMLIGFFS
jgi:pimeloyl-ACP methyl ester carboxylesterase